jgi:dUTPase
MKTKLFYGTVSPFYNDALAVRYSVFTVEQGYDASIDIDSTDAYAWHIVCYDQAQPIATARLYSNIDEQAYGIGRVAVLKAYRGKKLGLKVMDILLQQAMIEIKHRHVIVHAQTHAIPFYEKLGFVVSGEEFLEEGQPHREMQLTLALRGFEVATGYENFPVVIPTRKTQASAGYDLSLIEDTTIPPKTAVLAKTGLKAYMLPDEVLEIYIRSSIAIKQKVWCVNNVGVIDADYYNNPDNDGHLMIPLYNANDEAVTFKQGERVAQGIFKKYLTIDGEDASEFAERTGGFGSTGK